MSTAIHSCPPAIRDILFRSQATDQIRQTLASFLILPNAPLLLVPPAPALLPAPLALPLRDLTMGDMEVLDSDDDFSPPSPVIQRTPAPVKAAPIVERRAIVREATAASLEERRTTGPAPEAKVVEVDDDDDMLDDTPVTKRKKVRVEKLGFTAVRVLQTSFATPEERAVYNRALALHVQDGPVKVYTRLGHTPPTVVEEAASRMPHPGEYCVFFAPARELQLPIIDGPFIQTAGVWVDTPDNGRTLTIPFFDQADGTIRLYFFKDSEEAYAKREVQKGGNAKAKVPWQKNYFQPGSRVFNSPCLSDRVIAPHCSQAQAFLSGVGPNTLLALRTTDRLKDQAAPPKKAVVIPKVVIAKVMAKPVTVRPALDEEKEEEEEDEEEEEEEEEEEVLDVDAESEAEVEEDLDTMDTEEAEEVDDDEEEEDEEDDEVLTASVALPPVIPNSRKRKHGDDKLTGLVEITSTDNAQIAFRKAVGRVVHMDTDPVTRRLVLTVVLN